MDSPRAQSVLDRLTARQLQCLTLAARHWTSKDIARQLEIAPKTVDRHIEEAVRKLGVADRAAAVRILRPHPWGSFPWGAGPHVGHGGRRTDFRSWRRHDP